MHPNRIFRDENDLLGRAADIGLAHIFANTAAGPIVAHAPVTRHGDRLRFHLARANRLAPHLDGASVVLSLVGEHGYVSPNWYAGAPELQVPTWNYVGIEIEGIARTIDRDALVEQLDALAEAHEPRDDPWTRDKTDPAYFDKLLRAIVGFEIVVTAARGTTKLSQNKSAADRKGIAAGLVAEGNVALAESIPQHA